MTVGEGHVVDIDGATVNNNGSSSGVGSSGAGAKYKTTSEGRVESAAFKPTVLSASDVEDNNGTVINADRVSVLSGASGRSKTTSQLEAAAKLPWYKGITCKDIRDIMPTVLILIGGLLIMIFVIPYAFSSVIKQLKAEEDLKRAKEAAAAFDDNATMTSEAPLETETEISL